jgi:hypothetical protein
MSYLTFGYLTSGYLRISFRGLPYEVMFHYVKSCSKSVPYIWVYFGTRFALCKQGFTSCCSNVPIKIEGLGVGDFRRTRVPSVQCGLFSTQGIHSKKLGTLEQDQNN